ncbi:hypothetical protein Tco_0321530 [Tanacetum coccineum]
MTRLQLIEVSARTALMNSIVVAIPIQNDPGHTLETIDIEYEWQPPRCDMCKIFDHNDSQCPKNVKAATQSQHLDDGFIEVKRKNGKEKLANKPRQVDGIRLNKPKPNYFYRPISMSNKGSGDASTSHSTPLATDSRPAATGTSNVGKSVETNSPKITPTCISNSGNNIVSIKNSFEALMEKVKTINVNNDTWEANTNDVGSSDHESDSEDVENIIIDQPMFMGERTKQNIQQGASTPSNEVINENKLFVCAILESHVANSRLDSLCSRVFRHWIWSSNCSSCIKADKNELFCSFVYAHNRYTLRHALWRNLNVHKHYVRGRPWCLLGDFNVALHLEDYSGGSSTIDIAMREFKERVDDIEISDVNHTSLRFTWNQKPKGDDDHSPAVLKLPMISNSKPRPFKFSNILVVKKLKFLKKPLCKLLYDQGNIHTNVDRLRHELDIVQRDLDADPFNIHLRKEEAAYVQDFNDALITQERFLKQKAKIEWLHVGDSNTAYFHKVVKGRVSSSRIDAVFNADGVQFDGDQVPLAFGSHYTSFLGHQGDSIPLNLNDLFTNNLDPNAAHNMIHNVTLQEVKDAIFSMGNDKFLGPDGYSAAFLKKLGILWRMILLRLFKNSLLMCISKIIANHIKGSLSQLVSLNQSAFVLGRRKSDNILLTQELMHNYHLDHGPARFAFKVDIQKAYDIVDWAFLRNILIGFGFHPRMVAWIMECVSSTSYSISINDTLHGYFKGKRGLRQGDPMSPYLFTLVMEVLMLIIQRRVEASNTFTYHHYCSILNIINLCFADDLFLFVHGDVNSAKVIMEALDEFKLVSDLVPSKLRLSTWLVQSVLSLLYVYWASIFILPSRIMLDLEQLIRGFFWCQGDMLRGKAKVSWEVVCLPKEEGAGNKASLWFDRWSSLSPLSQIITVRDIHRAGFELSNSVMDGITNGNWSWPVDWYVKYPLLNMYTVPTLNPNTLDRIFWISLNGSDNEFTVSIAWDTIHPRGDVVN